MTDQHQINPIPIIAAALERGDIDAHYDREIDEMEFVLPGGAGREGRAILVGGELYVRLALDSGEPLSIVIPGFSFWVERQEAMSLAAPAGPPSPKVPGKFVARIPGWSETASSIAYQAVYRTVRYSNDLYAGAAR